MLSETGINQQPRQQNQARNKQPAKLEPIGCEAGAVYVYRFQAKSCLGIAPALNEALPRAPFMTTGRRLLRLGVTPLRFA